MFIHCDARPFPWPSYNGHHTLQLWLCRRNDLCHSTSHIARASSLLSPPCYPLIPSSSSFHSCTHPRSHKPRHLPPRTRIHSRIHLLPHHLCNLVHVYERYVTMVTIVVMLFLWNSGGTNRYDLGAHKSFKDTGKDLGTNLRRS